MANSTLLTCGLSQQDIEDAQRLKDEQQLHSNRIDILCQCYVESLKDNSYSYKNTVESLSMMIEHCINKEFICAGDGNRLLGFYIRQCLPFSHHSGSRGIQVPSALAKVVQDATPHLRREFGCKSASSNNSVADYEYQHEVLSQYIPITERQVKRLRDKT